MTDLYLVPFDFTAVTQGALEYALRLTASAGDHILLLHIVKNESKEDSAERKFENVMAALSDADRKRVSYKVTTGNLFEDISKVGHITEANAIVMGTHGAHGLQKILGSNALKVVSGSEIPFIITQNPADYSEIHKIVMPFSYAKETVQVVQFATTLAKKYKASIDLVGYHDKDEWLLKDMKVNQAVMRRTLSENGVDHSIVTLPGKKRYEKELVNYAKEINADLLAAAYFQESIIPALTGSFLQDLITNPYNIPVLTVNAHTLSKINASVIY